jgi:hypothetical protein
MKPMLKASKTEHLKRKNDEVLSSFAFKFKLRRYTKGAAAVASLADQLAEPAHYCLPRHWMSSCRLPRYRMRLNSRNKGLKSRGGLYLLVPSNRRGRSARCSRWWAAKTRCPKKR